MHSIGSDNAALGKRGTVWNTEAVQVQGSGDSGREHDAGSRTSANKYTTKDERIRVSGALESLQSSQSKEVLKVPF